MKRVINLHSETLDYSIFQLNISFRNFIESSRKSNSAILESKLGTLIIESWVRERRSGPTLRIHRPRERRLLERWSITGRGNSFAKTKIHWHVIGGFYSNLLFIFWYSIINIKLILLQNFSLPLMQRFLICDGY